MCPSMHVCVGESVCEIVSLCVCMCVSMFVRLAV